MSADAEARNVLRGLDRWCKRVPGLRYSEFAEDVETLCESFVALAEDLKAARDELAALRKVAS